MAKRACRPLRRFGWLCPSVLRNLRLPTLAIAQGTSTLFLRELCRAPENVGLEPLASGDRWPVRLLVLSQFLGDGLLGLADLRLDPVVDVVDEALERLRALGADEVGGGGGLGAV